METPDFNKEKIISYWLVSSDDDFDTMMAMYATKRFNWSLFIGHLMIEKLLKALFIKQCNEYPPFTHNLVRLAEKAGIQLDEEKRLFFVTVTAFNINARYDDYKMSFQKTCTPEFSKMWIDKLTENRLWIKQLIES